MIDHLQPTSQAPLITGDPLNDPVPGSEPTTPEPPVNRFEVFWEQIVRAGLVEPVARLATHAILVVMVLIVAWALRAMYFGSPGPEGVPGTFSAFAAPLPTAQRMRLPWEWRV
jgi:hypothetical protein